MSQREITELIGAASRGGVRKVLARLVSQGVVTEQRVGNQFSYSVNRLHLAWPAVELLATSIDRLIDLIAGSIQNWPVRPLSLAIHGSLASGASHIDSDIDLLVVGSEPSGLGWSEQLSSLVESIERWTGNGVDVLAITAGNFLEMGMSDEPLLRAPRVHVFGLDLTSQPPPAAALRKVVESGSSANPALQTLLDHRAPA